jgi:Ca2+-binding EF-hand superfamily protein
MLMPDSAKNRKFNIVFDWFDQGGDGYLTHDDFQQMTALFTALPGGDAPENAQALHDAFEKWWGLLLAEGDITEDGKLGREEFIDVMKSSVTAPENFEDAVIAIADAFMRIVDTGGDGSLSFDDYVRMYEVSASIQRIPATRSSGSTATAITQSAMRNSEPLLLSSISAMMRMRRGTGCWDH